MPREYRHISQYEKEILELRELGLTYQEIGEKLGFAKIQLFRTQHPTDPETEKRV